jgi:predicted acetyltransferase
VTKSCRLATSENLEECINIAKESFVESEDGVNRFNLDPNFKKDDIKKYYIEWVKNIFNKTSADEVIVYDDESIIKGFISIKKINNSEYNIPLNAVKRSERGKGIYKEMVNWIVDKLRGDGIKVNIRAYLGNVALQNTWLGLGAHIKEIEYIFHGGMYGK